MKSSHNIDGKRFTALFNASNGQVNHETIFDYHQDGDYVWAHYAKGEIRAGVLIGHFIDETTIELHYRHFDHHGRMRSGRCVTSVVLVNDKYRLHEDWVWDDDGTSGQSVLVEV